MSRGPLVETRCGRLRGAWEDPCEGAAGARPLAVFRGVPFAEPPVGPLRLRPPASPRAWSGVREAIRFGDAPPQARDPLVDFLGLLGERDVGEDCLTLNVWTPGCDDGRRPVMVWIHGGAFVSGAGAVPLYDGRRLAARGDVVVVTLNYRVGALGFLHLDGFTPADGSNLGLRDQIAALRWVGEHARALGGDPERITVFGESAGAGSIAALLAAPAAPGLFRRAIVQSAAPAAVATRAQASERARRLLAHLALRPDEAARILELPVPRLLEAQQALLADGPWPVDMPFVPVVDGGLLPRRPLDAVAAGSARDVELVVGTTAEEMRLFAWGADPSAVDGAALPGTLARELPLRLPADERARLAAGLVEGYRSVRAARGQAASPGDLLFAVQSDVRLRHPSIRLAEGHARLGSSTRMYLFTARSPFQRGELGSCHALDLPFTFGSLDVPGMAAFAGSGPAVEALGRRWMDAWLAFAHCGDPSHEGIGAWPRYDAERRATFAFGDACQVLEAPGDEERALLDEIDWSEWP